MDIQRCGSQASAQGPEAWFTGKAVTSMSPLQFQKVLRLHEARRLMLARMMDAGTACRQVGYLSSSQFSREYGRFFGSAPTKDIARLREAGMAGALAEA